MSSMVKRRSRSTPTASHTKILQRSKLRSGLCCHFVEEKFRDFLRPKGAKNHEIFRVNGEMRGKFGEIRPPIAKFLIEIGMKLQGEIMANFQILAPKSKSELEI